MLDRISTMADTNAARMIKNTTATTSSSVIIIQWIAMDKTTQNARASNARKTTTNSSSSVITVWRIALRVGDHMMRYTYHLF